jgi:diguanylate cyclase (GGDEF)-like protein
MSWWSGERIRQRWWRLADLLRFTPPLPMEQAMSGPVAVEGPGRATVAPAPGVSSADRLSAELEALEEDLGFDIAVVLAKAAEIEREAEASGDTVLRFRARLLQANMWQRQGKASAAARLLREVKAWATANNCRPLLARSDRLLTRVYYALGDTAACLEHAILAVQQLDDDTPARTRAAHLMALAGALASTGSFEAARERYQQAERFAIAAKDVNRHLAVLNNLAYSELEAGEPQRAWDVVLRLREVAVEHEVELNPNYLDTVAQAQIALGRYADAEQTTKASIEAFASTWEEEVDSFAQSLATLAVAQRHLGATAAAQEALDRCRALCEERDLAYIGVLALQEQAELYAACGDFERAFHTYKAYHTANSDLVSQQAKARAQTRQAMFETAEAREDAERFREQARRDPLTGLPNRRYMDEHLPAMLEAGTPIVAALMDVDHFKRVNDTLSHHIGDQVLVAIAGILSAAVPVGPAMQVGFAARTGGEEFLLVLAGTSQAAALRHVEALREAVAGHAWQPVTGELPVTVSIGVAVAGPDDAPHHLLARADERLYAAKREGRNRVCV